MGNSPTEVYQSCRWDAGTCLTPSGDSMWGMESFYQFLGNMRASPGLNLRQLESSAQCLSIPKPDREPKVMKDISLLMCEGRAQCPTGCPVLQGKGLLSP